jgi:type I restriction enzyme S subunit
MTQTTTQKIPTGYKQTEIGVIPEDWDVKKLGDVSDIIMGQSPLSEFYNIKGDGLPLIQGNADIKNRKTIIRTYTSSIIKRGRSGDIIMSVRAPVGEVSSAIFECCLGRGVCAIRFPNKYLYHYLIFFEKAWARFSTGSTFDSVNSAQVKEVLIPIPTFKSEQTAIATVLSDADALIEKLEKLIAKKKAVKQSAMQQLLTGKHRLPGFSGEWEVKKLGKIGEIVTGNTPSTKINEYWGGNIPWITPTDIGESKNIYNSEREITPLAFQISRKLPANTLLVTCIASIGKNVILRRSGACNQQINAIIPNYDHDVDFLYYLIENNKSYLLSKAGITATLIISKKEFLEIEFKVPKNKNEQTAIATVLSDMDAEIERLENKLAKYQQIKTGMMQQLLTGKIRLVKN